MSCNAEITVAVWRSVTEYFENCDKNVKVGGGVKISQISVSDTPDEIKWNIEPILYVLINLKSLKEVS